MLPTYNKFRAKASLGWRAEKDLRSTVPHSPQTQLFLIDSAALVEWPFQSSSRTRNVEWGPSILSPARPHLWNHIDTEQYGSLASYVFRNSPSRFWSMRASLIPMLNKVHLYQHQAYDRYPTVNLRTVWPKVCTRSRHMLTHWELSHLLNWCLHLSKAKL